MASAQKKLKVVMDRCKVKPYSLAQQANVPESSIKNILYGKSQHPRYELIVALAEKLGCKISDILADDDPRINDYYTNAACDAVVHTDSWNGELHLKAVRIVLEESVTSRIDLTSKKANEYSIKAYNLAKESGTNEIDRKFVRYVLKHGF